MAPPKNYVCPLKYDWTLKCRLKFYKILKNLLYCTTLLLLFFLYFTGNFRLNVV